MSAVFIVTGATGYIGNVLCKTLSEKGYEVCALCRNVPCGLLPENIRIVTGDVLKPETLETLFETASALSAQKKDACDLIAIHAAAIISVNHKDPVCYETNVAGTIHMVEACRKYHVKKLIYIGSVDALYNPQDQSLIPEPENFQNKCSDTDYAKSKRDASQIVLDAAAEDLDALVCMPSCVIGPGDPRDGFVSSMLKLYLKGLPPVSITGGYDFVDVRDLAEGIVQAALHQTRRRIYIFSGHYADITDLFNLAAEHLGRPKTKLVFSARLLYPALPLVSILFHLLKKRPPLSAEAVRLLLSRARFSRRLAVEDFGFQPRPFAETLSDTLDFLSR